MQRLAQAPPCQPTIDNAAEAIIAADRHGTIRLWNADAEAMFGHTDEEAIGKPLALIVLERFRKKKPRRNRLQRWRRNSGARTGYRFCKGCTRTVPQFWRSSKKEPEP